MCSEYNAKETIYYGDRINKISFTISMVDDCTLTNSINFPLKHICESKFDFISANNKQLIHSFSM